MELDARKRFDPFAIIYERAITALEFVAVVTICLIVGSCKDDSSPQQTNTFTVSGRFLFDPCGDQIVLKGVNKMSVFDENDPEGALYFPEIAKTGSNAVRIVWQQTYSNGASSNVSQLEALIKNCMKEKLIPIIEMHDATCNLNNLDDVVNYWISDEVLSVVKKYQHAMLVNIANEAGDYAVTDGAFVAAYKNAITKLRGAGISTTLIIDAPDCGKNLELVVPVASALVTHDPQHNIMLSAHPYWSKKAGANAAFITTQLSNAVSNNVPLLLGEVCAYGGWPGENSDEALSCAAEGEVDYSAILTEAEKNQIGWLLWEWGPGNGYYDHDPVVLCPTMDITTDGTYASIQNIVDGDPNAWAKDAVITGTYSIKNTAVKTAYLQNGFSCP